MIIRRLLALAVLTGIAGSATTSCADNNTQIFVRQVVAADPSTCTYKPDPGGTFWAAGALDVSLRNEYTAALLVGNQLVTRGSREQLRTETDRVTLRGAEVEVYNQDETQRTAFSVPGAGFVDPGAGDEPGYGVTIVTLIPAAETEKFRAAFGGDRSANATVTAAVRVFGDTLGGLEVQSGQLGFPILVCNGCLISYPLDAIDSTGQCIASPTFQASNRPCQLGQDQAVDCRLCGENPFCQST